MRSHIGVCLIVFGMGSVLSQAVGANELPSECSYRGVEETREEHRERLPQCYTATPQGQSRTPLEHRPLETVDLVETPEETSIPAKGAVDESNPADHQRRVKISSASATLITRQAENPGAMVSSKYLTDGAAAGLQLRHQAYSQDGHKFTEWDMEFGGEFAGTMRAARGAIEAGSGVMSRPDGTAAFAGVGFGVNLSMAEHDNDTRVGRAELFRLSTEAGLRHTNSDLIVSVGPRARIALGSDSQLAGSSGGPIYAVSGQLKAVYQSVHEDVLVRGFGEAEGGIERLHTGESRFVRASASVSAGPVYLGVFSTYRVIKPDLPEGEYMPSPHPVRESVTGVQAGAAL